MKRTTMGVLPLVLSLALAACEQPVPLPQDAIRNAERSELEGMHVTLATNSKTYSPGDEITVILVNRSRTPFGYNLCRAGLDRYIEDDWRQVQATLVEACTAELRTLYPGQRAAFSFRTERVLRRGQYRIRAVLSDTPRGTRVTAISNSFMLQGNDSD